MPRSLALVVASVSGCEPYVDRVFDSDWVRLETTELRVAETDGAVSLVVRLEQPAHTRVRATLVVRDGEAQSQCQGSDFELPALELGWEAGEQEASLELVVLDDDLAEIDESFELVVLEVTGTEFDGPTAIRVVIDDDDRTALVDVGDFGAAPDEGSDVGAALQVALDAALASGRGVVLLPPGDYLATTLVMGPGTSLVGHGATLRRPDNVPADTISVRVEHQGSGDSPLSLVQGLTLDGNRSGQGPFEELELENAHLLFVAGDVTQAGRSRARVEAVSFLNGTGDGLAVGPNADVEACGLRAHDVFREGLSVHGGNSRVRLQGFTATATLGTTGIWLDGNITGFEGRRTVDLSLEDVELESGDLEIEIADGSRLDITRLTMGAAPFRIQAPGSTVRISDSVLQLGVPSERHNHWDRPDDVLVTRSTLIGSESIDEMPSAPEADRTWAIVRTLFAEGADGSATARLSFEECAFELAADVETTDTVFVAESLNPGGQLLLRDATITACACEWFAPECVGCER